MILADGSWSLGVLFGLPIAVIAFLLCVAWIVAWTAAGEPGLGWLGAPAAVVVVAFTAYGFYPYKAEYHKWNEVGGKIDAIEKRIVGGDSIQEKFVVRFVGSGQEYGCEDTRCALLKPADVLYLSCKRVWQYAGTDGYDCKYVRGGRNA